MGTYNHLYTVPKRETFILVELGGIRAKNTTEQQSNLDWKGHSEVIYSNHQHKARLIRSDCPGPCPAKQLNNSRDTDSTASLGILFQHLTILCAKKILLTSHQSHLCS